MRLLKICMAAIFFMAMSLGAYAGPLTGGILATGKLMINNGHVTYTADGASNNLYGDGHFANMNYYGTFNFSTSLTGNPPTFNQNVNWYLSGEGGYSNFMVDGSLQTPGAENASVDHLYLGYGSASDLFDSSILDYSDILPAIAAALPPHPTLADIIAALTGGSVLDSYFSSLLLSNLPTYITDNAGAVYFNILNSNTIGFASNLGLSINGIKPASASVDFRGSITLQAVPEPGALGLLGFGLIGIIALGRRKRIAA